MKYLLGLLLFLSPLGTALAVDFNRATVPFTSTTVTNLDNGLEQSVLGNLSGTPHLYDFKIATTTVVTLQLEQPANQLVPFSFILVKSDDVNSSVSEIGRWDSEPQKWNERYDVERGLVLSHTDLFNHELTPGSYRLEISSPDNTGLYWLRFNVGSGGGYFAGLTETYRIQHFFGYSPLQIFKSSLVYYPIGIIVTLVGIYITWHWRRKFYK